MRASVLLPEPLGPRTAAQEFCGTCQVMSFNIQRLERSTPTFFRSMAGSRLFASAFTSIQYEAEHGHASTPAHATPALTRGEKKGVTMVAANVPVRKFAPSQLDPS